MSAAEKTVWACIVLVILTGLTFFFITVSAVSSVAVLGALMLDVIYGGVYAP